MSLLEVNNLQTHFFTDDGVVKACDDVSFSVGPREVLGIVGGQVLWKGQDLLKKTEPEMRKIRGDDIAMIFQEPMTSLDPLYTVGNHIEEALLLHQNLRGAPARSRAIEALREVGINEPESRVDAYPHQLSGGMRQRVMIAVALSCNPDLLIADEPTTALDVTVQAKVLDLLKKLRAERDMAILLITHNMGLVAEMCDRVVVMHRGKVVEAADVQSLFEAPRHPYTQGLLRSIPTLDSPLKQPLPTLDYHVSPHEVALPLVEVSAGHWARVAK